jgi:hypothetical protein
MSQKGDKTALPAVVPTSARSNGSLHVQHANVTPAPKLTHPFPGELSSGMNVQQRTNVSVDKQIVDLPQPQQGYGRSKVAESRPKAWVRRGPDALPTRIARGNEGAIG